MVNIIKYGVICFYLVLLLCGNQSHAQSANAAFRNITSADGLPQTSVSAIAQDAFGLIWIASWDGVYRYDGTSYKKISSFDCRRITADKSGGMWISPTIDGRILFYNSLTDSITSYEIPRGGRGINIQLDDAGSVWAGTDVGLYKYDSVSNAFRLAIQDFDKNVLRFLTRGNGEVLMVYRDEKDRISKLAYRHPNGKVDWQEYPIDINNPVKGKNFVDEYPPFDMAWYGEGIIMFNRYGWALKERPGDNWTFGQLADHARIDLFNDVILDGNGNAWLNQLNTLQKINIKTGNTIIYRRNDADQNSLLPLSGLGSGTQLCIDRQGVLWIPRYGSGISRLNLYENDFGLIKDEQGEPLLDILSVLELEDGTFFIGSRTEDNGLYHFSSNKKVIRRYGTNSFKAPPGKTISNQLSHPFPWALAAAGNGNVWVGTGWPVTSDGGLNLLKPGSSVITRYKHDSTDPHSIPDDWIRKIVVRKDGKIWVASTYKGWFLFDPVTEKAYTGFERDSIRWFGINSIITSRGDLLYERNGAFKQIIGETLQSQPLKIDFGVQQNLRLCMQDSLQRVWFTNNKGFGYFNNQLERIEWFYDIAQHKLPVREVNMLCFDNTGKLWLTTDNGLVRFDTADNSYVHYSIDRGLQGNYFDSRTTYKGVSGRLYFGGNGGINVFDPEEIHINPFAPEMVFTGLKLDGKAVQFGKSTALSVPIVVADQITVGPDVDVISIDFAAIHFAGTGSNQYQYRLEGFDKDWREGGKTGNATYTNLSAGSYKLYIKGMNWDGVWSDGNKYITIRILPPWYETWWAYLCYGILVLLLLWRLFVWQKNRTIRKERERAQQKELEQAREIEKAYTDLKATQAQLIQSEKMASLGELTAGIAHEIQNPLNFVNNFSEINKELLHELKEEAANGNLAEVKAIADDLVANEEKIAHHGKRADMIVKGMLQHSQSSSGQKEPTDINALCDEYLRLAYHGLRAKDKSFNATIKTDFDNSIGNINIIPQDIGRVILNLINNAFYAVDEKKKETGEGYEPTVSLSTKIVGDKIEIAVADNGNGIPDAIREKIFQPFFTTKPTGSGTGLGLSLSYDIVKAHGGEIKVEFTEGDGTMFIIQLPLR